MVSTMARVKPSIDHQANINLKKIAKLKNGEKNESKKGTTCRLRLPNGKRSKRSSEKDKRRSKEIESTNSNKSSSVISYLNVFDAAAAQMVMKESFSERMYVSKLWRLEVVATRRLKINWRKTSN